MNRKEFEDNFVSLNDFPMGGGSQKAVYRGVHKQYGDVVVKYIKELTDREKREIEIVLNNNFLHVPKIYEVVIVEDEDADRWLIIEQYIDGSNLREVIVDGITYDIKEIVSFLEQGLYFIEQIWECDIIHRDIKPENIMMDNAGVYYFIDFGIARDLNAESITKTGMFMPNTPGYAAPELLVGDRRDIDTRVDLFSLGVVAYELVTGVNPFRRSGESPFKIYYNTMTITPIDIELEGDKQNLLKGLIASMMNKDKYKRPKDADKALLWLKSALSTLETE